MLKSGRRAYPNLSLVAVTFDAWLRVALQHHARENLLRAQLLAPSQRHVHLEPAKNPQAQTHRFWCAFTAGLPPASATRSGTLVVKTKSLISAATASRFLLFF
jgi:hypothetical protein